MVKKINYFKKLKSKFDAKIDRKLKAENEAKRNSLEGLAFIGAIGWNLCLPILFGIWIGLKLDKKYSKNFFTISFMFLGLIMGFYNTFNFIKRNGMKK